jgi:hypothetical protein
MDRPASGRGRRPTAEGREPLLTAVQVAGRFHVSEAQVYRLARTTAPICRGGGRPGNAPLRPGSAREIYRSKTERWRTDWFWRCPVDPESGSTRGVIS